MSMHDQGCSCSFLCHWEEEGLVYELHPHKIYRYIRSLSGHVSLPDIMYWDSTSAQSDSDKANLFNKFFHSVFTVDIESTTPHVSTLPASSLCSIDISLEDTFLALSSCDPSKAMGGDGIPPMILKHAASALAEPVHHLFSLCLTKSSSC